MENIDKVTEHVRAKLPGQLTLRRPENLRGGREQFLADDQDLFYETIPDFHITKRRYEVLLEAAKADPAGQGAEKND